MTGSADRPYTLVGNLFDRLRTSRRWTPDDRARLEGELYPTGSDAADFVWRFVTLMILSTIIAALGLLANSTAVVIGAMLVAPLMTPILGVALAVVLGMPGRLFASLALIAGGVVLAIAAAVAVSAIAPGTVTGEELTGELLARTAPSLLDLGVALAAGLAAGYVITHPHASASLPGVAIAVALVPPLATIGVALQLGAGDQARGAFLLFATNLLAIVLAAMMVAIASGVVPSREGESVRGVVTGLAVTAVMLVAVAVPLAIHTIDVVEDQRFERDVLAGIGRWDPTSEILDVRADVRSDGAGDISVVVATSNEPVPAWRLARLLREATGRRVTVDVQYVLETVDAAEAD